MTGGTARADLPLLDMSLTLIVWRHVWVCGSVLQPSYFVIEYVAKMAIVIWLYLCLVS